MNRTGTSLVFVVLTLLGTIAMAAEPLPQNVIKWAPAPGIENPPPPAAMLYNDKIAIAYFWGTNDPSQWGLDNSNAAVGKYEVQLTQSMKDKIAEAEHALVKNIDKLHDGPTKGTVMEFNFNKNKNNYYGYYSTGLGESFVKKLWPVSDLYTTIVLKGKPIILLKSSVIVKLESNELSVTLVLKNKGTEAITLAGPATWSEHPGLLPAHRIQVIGYKSDKRIFDFALSVKNFTGNKALLNKIQVLPKQSTELKFTVRLSNLHYFSNTLKGELPDSSFEYAGILKVKIVAPSDMAGTLFTFANN